MNDHDPHQARRLFAIGDIHGHATELLDLMDRLSSAGMVPERDTIVFLGDDVDSGPDTKTVLEHLIDWQQRWPHWVFLKGNHEDMMLDALVFNSQKYGFFGQWWGQGGKETAHSYLPAGASKYEKAIMQPAEFIPTAHLAWLNALPLMYEQDGYAFVHAGFLPGLPLHAQNETDMLWIRDRFIASDWHFEGKRVVFGHTPLAEPLVMPNKIGIDTVFHNHGKLTAVELDTQDPDAEPRFFFSHPINITGRDA